MKDKDAIPVEFIKTLAEVSKKDRDTLEFLLKLWETHNEVFGPQEEKEHGETN